MWSDTCSKVTLCILMYLKITKDIQWLLIVFCYFVISTSLLEDWNQGFAYWGSIKRETLGMSNTQNLENMKNSGKAVHSMQNICITPLQMFHWNLITSVNRSNSVTSSSWAVISDQWKAVLCMVMLKKDIWFSGGGDLTMLNKIPVSAIERPQWRL